MKFIVEKSKIHGKGLFTCKNINAGETLGGFGWRPCNNKTEKDSFYGLNLDDGKVILMTCDFKYINHSIEPNVCLYDDNTIIAIRDIKAGDEIISDYEEFAPL